MINWKMMNVFIFVIVGTVVPVFGLRELRAQPPLVKLYDVDQNNKIIRLYDQVGNQRSEVIIEKSDHLRLECHAYYPVQWIYTGNGIPIISTFVSMSTMQEGSEILSNYIVSAFISPVKEEHTGNYQCSRTEYITLSPSIYIYVPGDALFTSQLGKTIEIPRNDSNILIPCSVSHPRTSVSLEILDEKGMVRRIAESDDSYVYDPRKGFRVNVNKLDDPEGTYVCIARYNNLVRRVNYTVTSHFARPPQNLLEFRQRSTETCFGSSCGIHCESHTDCPPLMNCYTDHICRDPCVYSIRCGKSSLCRVIDNVPECYCPPDFVGDATEECFDP